MGYGDGEEGGCTWDGHDHDDAVVAGVIGVVVVVVVAAAAVVVVVGDAVVPVGHTDEPFAALHESGTTPSAHQARQGVVEVVSHTLTVEAPHYGYLAQSAYHALQDR